MNAFEAAEKNGRAEDLQKELDTLFQQPEPESERARPRRFPPPILRVTVERP